MKISIPVRILFLSLLIVCANTLQAQITVDHVASIQTVGSSVISPDGKHIAYTLLVPADPKVENRPASVHLYLYDVSARTSTALITDGNVSNLQFRPKKGTITFTSRRSGDSASSLYEIPVTGGEPVRLHAHETSILGYSWGADGSHVAYTANEMVERPKTGLPYEPELFEQYIPNRKAYLQNVDMEGHEPHLIDIPGSAYLVALSPDLSKLAVSVAPTPGVDDSFMAVRIHIVDHKTKEVLNKIDNAGKLGQIVWSPDSKQLAIRAGNDIHDPIDGRILTVSADGGVPTNILPDFKGKFEQIAWTDANTLHFLASEGVFTSFGTLRPDGSRLSRIIEPGDPVLTSFSLASDGSVAFTGHSPSHPAEVFHKGRRNRDTLRRATTSNAWLADVKLAKQEVVKYSARDGLDLEGILIRPLNEAAGSTYPLITVVHGGPEAHYLNGWLTGYNSAGQVGAARGFAVFYPNYRGSTGRGLEFAMSSQADLAGKEFDDVVDGVDMLIDIGLVDKDRVGVNGGSYGGYATAWMSTYYSDRFAAGVMFVGISNNISKWGTSDIPEELYLVHARSRVWDSWQDKLERSPIYHVEKSRTPLLIMHGKDDTRVHPAQSLELYRHLKVRKPDLPVELVLYPGEGHGNRNSTARYDYNIRMLDWFERFLK